jgi:hypothetical protein
MWQARHLRDHIDELTRLSRNVKEPEDRQEIADELRIVASVAYVVNFAATLDQNVVAKASNLTRNYEPLSRALGLTRLGTVKVNGRHRIRAQYGRVSLPDACEAAETSVAS